MSAPVAPSVPTDPAGSAPGHGRTGVPVVQLGAVLAALGVLAFVAGLTKRWVLDPIGEWFGDQSPGVKALIVTVVVVGVGAAIAWVRLRHRLRVQAARRVVDQRSAVGQDSTAVQDGDGSAPT